MKKLLLLTLFIIPLLSATTTDNVYVCTGKYSKSYHNNLKCRGIKACKSEVKTISLAEAQKSHRKPCKLCYGRL